jgi:hypothetical protein
VTTRAENIGLRDFENEFQFHFQLEIVPSEAEQSQQIEKAQLQAQCQNGKVPDVKSRKFSGRDTDAHTACSLRAHKNSLPFRRLVLLSLQSGF